MPKVDYERRRAAFEQQRQAITERCRYQKAGQSHEEASRRARREMERVASRVDKALDEQG